MSHAPAHALRLGPLAAADRADWLVLARGYKAFYQTSLPDADYDEAWQALLAGGPLLGLGAWRAAAHQGPAQGRLLGIAHAVFHASVWAPRVCYLQDLFVAPTARGCGVAEALIAQLAAEARVRGASRLYWLTHSTNSPARALYDRVARHHGFIRYDHPMAPPPP